MLQESTAQCPLWRCHPQTQTLPKPSCIVQHTDMCPIVFTRVIILKHFIQTQNGTTTFNTAPQELLMEGNSWGFYLQNQNQRIPSYSTINRTTGKLHLLNVIAYNWTHVHKSLLYRNVWKCCFWYLNSIQSDRLISDINVLDLAELTETWLEEFACFIFLT